MFAFWVKNLHLYSSTQKERKLARNIIISPIYGCMRNENVYLPYLKRIRWQIPATKSIYRFYTFFSFFASIVPPKG